MSGMGMFDELQPDPAGKRRVGKHSHHIKVRERQGAVKQDALKRDHTEWTDGDYDDLLDLFCKAADGDPEARRNLYRLPFLFERSPLSIKSALWRLGDNYPTSTASKYRPNRRTDRTGRPFVWFDYYLIAVAFSEKGVANGANTAKRIAALLGRGMDDVEAEILHIAENTPPVTGEEKTDRLVARVRKALTAKADFKKMLKNLRSKA